MSEATPAASTATGAASAAPVATRDRVPMWLAVSITVVVSLPFGLWLGNYNLPLWVSFIVWAEYFVLGQKPAALKIIIPAFLIGVIGAMCITTATAILEQFLGGAGLVAENDAAAFIGMFLGFCVLLYAARWLPVDGEATLPFFNGVSMMLGVYFTAAFITAASDGISPTLEPAVAAVGAALAGLLGCFLGWFNVTILFRQAVRPGGTAAPDRPR
ncbi:MAG: DUF1097 domain-containing protein [Chloroflexota bacterium]|nr:DUF1097 domain-containing protein [Chloroflexota bacterium]